MSPTNLFHGILILKVKVQIFIVNFCLRCTKKKIKVSNGIMMKKCYKFGAALNQSKPADKKKSV